MELETLKFKEVPMQKLETLIAEKACLSHFHHCWGKKPQQKPTKKIKKKIQNPPKTPNNKITHLSLAVTHSQM